MKVFLARFIPLLLLPVSACAQDTGLDAKIQKMLAKSLPRMDCNIGHGNPGSVIASPENHDPDYYYHWVRDSALIADSLDKLLPFEQGTANEKKLRKFMTDFSLFSEKLQHAKSAHGLGEVRYHPDGSVDTSEWPRPQYDGPALRALALMRYLDSYGPALETKSREQMQRVIRRDLDAVAKYHNEKGFDLWEYSSGFHFYTRLVQKSALARGQKLFGQVDTWSKAEAELGEQLNHHWNAEKGIIRFNDGQAVDDKGKKVPRSLDHYDTSVVLAVNHAAVDGPDFDNMDARVWSTLRKLEDFFQHNFPANQGKKLGFGIGRHPGDGYYGGNSFFFLTAGYAEHSFRLAEEVSRRKGEIVADALRRPTLAHVLQRPVAEGEVFNLPNAELAKAFAKNGEAFLHTMLDVIPADGMMAEQFSKKDGSPASAKDLTWSYGSLLTAVLEREKFQRSTVDYSKLKFRCPVKQKTVEEDTAPGISAE